MRLVFDTNVVVSGLLWHGPPREMMRAALHGEVLIFTSVPLLIELAATLGDPKFETKVAASMLTVDQLIERYTSAARSVMPVDVPRLVSDADDDVVIGTAVASQADFVVTGDKALLAVKQYKNVGIVPVNQVLATLAANRTFACTSPPKGLL